VLPTAIELKKVTLKVRNYGSDILIPKYLLGYITPMEENSCLFNRISGVAILVPIMCGKYDLVTF
jgi:hypothetical protein